MKPLTPRARVVLFVFVAVIAAACVSAISNTALLGFVDRAEAGDVTEEEGNAIDERQQLVGLVQVAAFIACAIVFLMWLHRASWNMIQAGLRPANSPGWAVGSFFIPILNLYKPYQVVKEVWTGSATLAESDPDRPGWSKSSSALVGWWWAAFLLMNLLGNIAGQTYLGAKSIDAIRSATVLMIASDVLDVLAALVAIVLVRRVTAFQERALHVRQLHTVF